MSDPSIPETDEWAAHVDAFVDDHYASLRGRVRTHVIDQHLATHLAPGGRVVDLSALLTRHGVDPVVWYGVRLFTDAWSPDRRAEDPDQGVLAVELEASRRDPYRQLSRLFHLVGEKR